MAQIFNIHPDNPQSRFVEKVAEALQSSGTIIAYPTDSAYALGCKIGDAAALEKIRAIRQLGKDHNFTLMCRNLSELSTFAIVDTPTFRLLKANTPGPYTFILNATKEVPKRLQHPKRKTIGLRVPDNKIALAILEGLDSPLMSVTLIMPLEKMPLGDPDEIAERLDKQVDIIVNGGYCGPEPTTVVEFTDDKPRIARIGKGDIKPFS